MSSDQESTIGRASATRTELCGWLHFAARSGEAGRAWTDAYRCHLPLVERSDQALAYLRRRRFGEAEAELRRCAAELAGLPAFPSSVRWVVERFFYGSLAYLRYCLGDLDEAEQLLRRADEALVAAIRDAGFLLPLAIHCQELCLHQARIARNGRRWPEMHAHVERARAMVLGRAPLCDLGEGRSIYFADVCRFFRSFSMSPAEEETIRGVVDDGERLRAFDRFVRRLYRLPGFAIQYP